MGMSVRTVPRRVSSQLEAEVRHGRKAQRWECEAGS